MKEFETVIGLEVHLQLKTKTKIFCGCANQFGREPNTQTCPVCLGLPGTLPVFNKQALEFAIKVALALNCKVNTFIKFDRKNYYYPDLPKGYQISQYDLPIASHGFVNIENNDKDKRVEIKRAHLEEDAGKLVHDTTLNNSLVDYNRTGTPLMEIVSEPDLRSPEEAYNYLTVLKLTLQYLDVSDCDMEKGSLRCDANISLREKGAKDLGSKVEVKNMNSFRAVKSALEFEETRQRDVLISGERIPQETRLWNEEKNITSPMRSKEEAHDYRYFPEPDLVPFVTEESAISKIRQTMPELPAQKFSRFLKEYSLSAYDARIIIQDRHLAAFFEECVQAAKNNVPAKKIANWVIGPLQQEINSRKAEFISISKSLTPERFIALIMNVEKGILSNLVGKEILSSMIETGESADQISAKRGLSQVSNEAELEKIIEEVFKEHKDVVGQIKEGKESAMGFLIGQSMRKSQGKANPKVLGDLIKRRLHNV